MLRVLAACVAASVAASAVTTVLLRGAGDGESGPPVPAGPVAQHRPDEPVRFVTRDDIAALERRLTQAERILAARRAAPVTARPDTPPAPASAGDSRVFVSLEAVDKLLRIAKGQSPGPPSASVDDIAADLKLTPEQRQTATTAVAAFEEDMARLYLGDGTMADFRQQILEAQTSAESAAALEERMARNAVSNFTRIFSARDRLVEALRTAMPRETAERFADRRRLPVTDPVVATYVAAY